MLSNEELFYFLYMEECERQEQEEQAKVNVEQEDNLETERACQTGFYNLF